MSDWRALLTRIRPHRRTLALSGVLALFGAAGGLAQPLAAREVIEALGNDDSLLVPLLVLGGLVAFSSTEIAARGASLSGGERQRIAIARALLRRPVLLLQTRRRPSSTP